MKSARKRVKPSTPNEPAPPLIDINREDMIEQVVTAGYAGKHFAHSSRVGDLVSGSFVWHRLLRGSCRLYDNRYDRVFREAVRRSLDVGQRDFL